ncbi:MAG: aldehyde dehydrogenase family protein [Candidatus Eremiobacterota bacterium]
MRVEVKKLQCVSPVDQSVYAERPLADSSELARALDRARTAQRAWRHVPLGDRIALLERLVDRLLERSAEIATELSWQMGRPISQAPGELRGFAERARTMLALAPEALADLPLSEKPGFARALRREPVGVVLTIAAWNYPYLIAVNSVVPALAAGNAVLLKHSAQTPLCAERMVQAGREAGLPQGVFECLHMDHEVTRQAVGGVDFVAFTGSVEGGHSVTRAASDRFLGMGLELGGKDPAYVRADAPFEHSLDNLVDGAFFNSGQSCCGIERIYVHRSLFQRFVDGFVDRTKAYRLGHPLHPETTLGPVVKPSAARAILEQVERALRAGATALIDPVHFPEARPEAGYLAPQVLVDVDHSMDVMTEETFGPVVGIMAVDSDEEAVRRMNDSRYGLTASVWTRDVEAAWRIGEQVETGTFFMNRCDYLDPELAWTGVKDTGRGCTLSRVGFEPLTRPKSYHLRLP